MKKILAIGLSMLLLVATVGVTITNHYCNAVLVETSFFASPDDACDTDMPMAPGSCKDDHQHYGVDSPLVLLSTNIVVEPVLTYQAVLFSPFKDHLFNQLNTPNLMAEISPPPSEPDIYTKVQSFLL